MIIKKISKDSFQLYGKVIEYPNKERAAKKTNLFYIVLNEPKKVGWRIAYLALRDKSIDRLEQHPGSFESFEPIKGRTILFVAKSKNPARIAAFLLDKPIILNKGIWHGVVTLGIESEIKITENNQVSCIFWQIPAKLPLK